MSEQSQVKRPRADAERNRVRLLDAAKAAFSSGQTPTLEQIARAADELLSSRAPERALRAWMDVFANYVAAKREMADALRAVFAAGSVTVSQAREELTVAVRTILDAGVADGTLRDDVRPEDVVAMIVGAFTATSLAGGQEQRGRMFDLLVDAVRRP